MISGSQFSAVVAATGLTVTGAGTFMTSRGFPAGKSAWAVGGVITLTGLVFFLGSQIHSRRFRAAADSPSIARIRPSLLVTSSRLTAIVLVTLGVLAIGVAAYQAVLAAWGWRPGLAVAIYAVSTGLMVLATGLALWLVANTAGRVDELLVYARRNEHSRRPSALATSQYREERPVEAEGGQPLDAS